MLTALLFPLDVAVRRLHLTRRDLAQARARVSAQLGAWRGGKPRPAGGPRRLEPVPGAQSSPGRGSPAAADRWRKRRPCHPTRPDRIGLIGRETQPRPARPPARTLPWPPARSENAPGSARAEEAAEGNLIQAGGVNESTLRLFAYASLCFSSGSILKGRRTKGRDLAYTWRPVCC